MKCAAVDGVPGLWIDFLHAAQHLRSRFAGEGDEQNAAWVNAGGNEPGGAMDEDLRFSAAGAGDHENRALRCAYDGELLGIEQ